MVFLTVDAKGPTVGKQNSQECKHKYGWLGLHKQYYFAESNNIMVSFFFLIQVYKHKTFMYTRKIHHEALVKYFLHEAIHCHVFPVFLVF